MRCRAGAGAEDRVMDAVLLHALNHCARAADRIKRTNDALKGGLPAEDTPRDQGFTRAKVRPHLPQL